MVVRTRAVEHDMKDGLQENTIHILKISIAPHTTGAMLSVVQTVAAQVHQRLHLPRLKRACRMVCDLEIFSLDFDKRILFEAPGMTLKKVHKTLEIPE